MFVKDGRIEFGATDNRRLAIAWAELNEKAEIEQVVVSRDMLARLRTLAASGTAVELAVDGGKLLARAGDVLVAGALMEGTFPAYMKMLPEEAGERVALSPVLFASKLRQASQLTTDESRAVSFTIDEDRMLIEAKSAAVGEGTIELDVAYAGEPVTVAFNPQYLLQALGEFDEEQFGMEVTSEEKPVVMRRDGFIYVVAPVRLRR